MSNATQLIHSIPVDPLTGSISVPIYQTSTFVQEAPGRHKGYDYARTNNPTRNILENIISQLEEGAGASAFASGLAAIDAVVKLLQSGDEILAVDDIYGGAYRLFTQVYSKFGISTRFVNTSNLQEVKAAISANTKLLWLETPTNPTLKISDIKSIATICKEKNILLCVDNTFASPVNQKPLTLGADIVVHSATKYIGGHSDLIAGLVICKSPALAEQIKFIQNASGAILAPHDSWLVIKGLETLHLRIKEHNQSAQIIAEYLENHPAVSRVYYPGLASHPNHTVAKNQASGFGGVVSFTLHTDTEKAATAVVTKTQLFKLAESLGGVKSLLCQPATMTHKSIPAAKRHTAGVKDSLIRLSVGLENVEDLIHDLEQALPKTKQHTQTKVAFETLAY